MKHHGFVVVLYDLDVEAQQLAYPADGNYQNNTRTQVQKIAKAQSSHPSLYIL